MQYLPVFSYKWLLLLFFFIPSLIQHHRGRVKLKLFRQLFNHSTLLAPLNVLLYWYSAVPNKPYLETQSIPNLQLLKDNWQLIRQEAQALLHAGEIEATGSQGDLAYQSFIKRGWRRFFIKWYSDTAHPSAQQFCPKTIELLKQVPEVKAALFAYLPAGGRLTAHRDPYAGSLRYQLGLITPNSDDCQIIIDNQAYTWHDGDDVLFDETFVHNAYNRTDTDRLVLFCDVERPLTARWMVRLNRWFAQTFIASAKATNNAQEQAGLLNRIFPWVLQLQSWAKVQKQNHRTAFQLIKYSCIMAALLWVLFG